MVDSSMVGRPTESAGISRGVKVAAAVASLPVSVLINLGARQVTDTETASLVAAAIPGVAFTGIEYLSRRRQAPAERIRAAVQGYYKPPLLMAIYVVFALQVCQSVIGFLVGLGVGIGLSPYNLSTEATSSVAVTTALVVIVPLVAIFLIFIGRAAAHRIKEHAFGWLALALAINIGLNLITSLALVGADDFNVTALDVIAIGIVNALYFGAAWVGSRWAQRTQALHVLSQAYLNLSPENRAALVELALPKVEKR